MGEGDVFADNYRVLSIDETNQLVELTRETLGVSGLPAPLSGGLLQRTHLSITGRALREVVVPGIGDGAIPPSELDQ